MKTPVNGFKYISDAGEVNIPDDLPTLVPYSDDEQSDNEPKPTSLTADPIQRGNRPEAIEFVKLCENLGWCRVVGNRMFSLIFFQQGPLRKPRIEIQAMAAFKALEADYALIRQVICGHLSIIDACINLSYRKRLYYSQ